MSYACCSQDAGYALTDDELNRAFIRFKDLADKKKEISTLDLASIVNDEIRDMNIRRYELVGMQVFYSTRSVRARNRDTAVLHGMMYTRQCTLLITMQTTFVF